MANTYDETHKNILDSAKSNFLEYGYERSNLRAICKGAKVTTGAFYRHFKGKDDIFDSLVKEAISELKKLYYAGEEVIYKTVEKENIEKFWNVTDSTIISFVNLIYKYYDEFRLVILFSDGTKYENFVHEIADMETENTMKFIIYLKNRGYEVKDITEKEIHMLIQAYFSSIFEVIVHEYSKEEAVKCIRTVIEFYKPGWKNIFAL